MCVYMNTMSMSMSMSIVNLQQQCFSTITESLFWEQPDMIHDTEMDSIRMKIYTRYQYIYRTLCKTKILDKRLYYNEKLNPGVKFTYWFHHQYSLLLKAVRAFSRAYQHYAPDVRGFCLAKMKSIQYLLEIFSVKSDIVFSNVISKTTVIRMNAIKTNFPYKQDRRTFTELQIVF